MTTNPVLEFWFQFDDTFNPVIGSLADDVFDAFAAIGGPPGITSKWRADRSAGTYPAGFAAAMQAVADAVNLLAARQLAIIDHHFAGDRDAERTAFEEFAMGIHFDDRRPSPDKVHKMDTHLDGSTTGYHDWHAFARAAVAVGEDADRWLGIDRNVGLAWAIQTITKPKNDATDNPRLPEAHLQPLREIWLPMTADQLDSSFDTQPFPADPLLGADA